MLRHLLTLVMLTLLLVPSAASAQLFQGPANEDYEPVVDQGFPEASSSSEASKDVLRVDVAAGAPFVIFDDEGGAPRGFDVDVIDALGKELGKEVRYRKVPFGELFDGVQDGTADVAAGAITVTAEREQRVDFAKHYFDSGLGILIRTEDSTSSSWLSSFWGWLVGLAGLFLSPVVYRLLLTLLFFNFVFGNIFWFIERGKNDRVSDDYFPGIFHAMWYVIVTITTTGYGDIVPEKAKSKWMAVGMMIVGGVVYAQLSGSIAAEYVIDSQGDLYQSPKDLRGKRVAVLAKSTAETTVRRVGASVVPAESYDRAFALLHMGKVDAVVADRPTLQYHAITDGAGKVKLSGPTFDVQYYGYAIPQGSEHEDINRIMLKFRENGTLDHARQEWLGE